MSDEMQNAVAVEIKGQDILDLSTAADHGRAFHHTTRVVKGEIEYKSHNITIYANPHGMRSAYQIKADDWN